MRPTTSDRRRGSPGKKREKLVTAVITVEVWERFKAFCQANGTNQSRMMRELIEGCLERQDSFLSRTKRGKNHIAQ